VNLLKTTQTILHKVQQHLTVYHNLQYKKKYKIQLHWCFPKQVDHCGCCWIDTGLLFEEYTYS